MEKLSKAVVLVRSSDVAGCSPVPGGLGPSSLDGTAPAPMLPVANRPLILHALDALADAGIRQAAVVVDGALASAVEPLLDEEASRRKLDITVVGYERGLGFGAAVSTVRNFVAGEPFVLHLGDSLQKEGLRALVTGSSLGAQDARVLTWQGPVEVSPRHAAIPLRPRVEPINGRRLRAVPPHHAGVYAFGAGAIDVASAAAEATDRDLGAPGLVDALDARGGHVEELDVCRGWRLGQSLEGWLEGNRLALEGLEAQTYGAHCFDTVIQGGVVIHPTAEIRSSMVRGPAIIGPLARLTDAYVGPYSSIAAGVLIEAAEIENSIILPGASIRYLGGRLESSIIGPRARVFRDFRLPKALRLSVGEGAEVALA